MAKGWRIWGTLAGLGQFHPLVSLPPRWQPHPAWDHATCLWVPARRQRPVSLHRSPSPPVCSFGSGSPWEPPPLPIPQCSPRHRPPAPPRTHPCAPTRPSWQDSASGVLARPGKWARWCCRPLVAAPTHALRRRGWGARSAGPGGAAGRGWRVVRARGEDRGERGLLREPAPHLPRRPGCAPSRPARAVAPSSGPQGAARRGAAPRRPCPP